MKRKSRPSPKAWQCISHVVPKSQPRGVQYCSQPTPALQDKPPCPPAPSRRGALCHGRCRLSRIGAPRSLLGCAPVALQLAYFLLPRVCRRSPDPLLRCRRRCLIRQNPSRRGLLRRTCCWRCRDPAAAILCPLTSTRHAGLENFFCSVCVLAGCRLYDIHHAGRADLSVSPPKSWVVQRFLAGRAASLA